MPPAPWTSWPWPPMPGRCGGWCWGGRTAPVKTSPPPWRSSASAPVACGRAPRVTRRAPPSAPVPCSSSRRPRDGPAASAAGWWPPHSPTPSPGARRSGGRKPGRRPAIRSTPWTSSARTCCAGPGSPAARTRPDAPRVSDGPTAHVRRESWHRSRVLRSSWSMTSSPPAQPWEAAPAPCTTRARESSVRSPWPLRHHPPASSIRSYRAARFQRRAISGIRPAPNDVGMV